MTDKVDSLELLRRALKPFADMAAGYESFDGEHDFVDGYIIAGGFTDKITVGDLRHARSVLAATSHLLAAPQATVPEPAKCAGCGTYRVACSTCPDAKPTPAAEPGLVERLRQIISDNEVLENASVIPVTRATLEEVILVLTASPASAQTEAQHYRPDPRKCVSGKATNEIGTNAVSEPSPDSRRLASELRATMAKKPYGTATEEEWREWQLTCVDYIDGNALALLAALEKDNGNR